MPEELQESRIDEHVAALFPKIHWLRLAYTFEFILALQLAVYLWTEIGGPAHMDLLPWYLKLPCVLLMAWSVVRFTAALVENEAAWTRRSRLWLAAIVGLAVVMFGITFYYHLHEVTDEPDTDQTSAAADRNPSIAAEVYRV